MERLVFVLGREPHLSVAELFAVLGNAVRWEDVEMSREAALVRSLLLPLGGGDKEGVVREQQPSRHQRGANSTTPSHSPSSRARGSLSRGQAEGEKQARILMSRLAGTVKIAEVLDVVPHASSSSFSSLTDAIGQHILAYTNASKRVRFGYSVYDLGGGAKEVQRVRAALTRGAKAQKAWLEERGRRVRHVTSRDATLSSVTVERQGLLPEDNGVEVCVLVGRIPTAALPAHRAPRVLQNRPRPWSVLQQPSQGGVVITLARTLAVQPYQEWSARDYGRPRRDARSGMLPPKLARMMVNIARVAPGGDLLDPFCGSGTVLMEAMLVGVPRVIGTDVSDTAVRDAQENVEWVRTNSSPSGAKRSRGAVGSTSRATISQCDVRQLSHCVREKVDVIVTEPYLGPAVGRQASRTKFQIPTITEDLRSLYRAAFREFAKVLAPNGRVVFIVPDYRLPIADYRPPDFDITADVAPLGFTRVNPFPPALRDHAVLRGRDDLPYARADQRVGRRILLFTYQPQS